MFLTLTLSLPPVPPDDPVIDGGPEVLLNAGESYNLSCVSRGAKPPSMIEWLKDGLPVDGAVSGTVSLKKNPPPRPTHAPTHTFMKAIYSYSILRSFLTVLSLSVSVL